MQKQLLSLTLLFLITLPTRAADLPKTITLSAGQFDRTDTIITFPLAADALNTIYELVSDNQTLQVQILPSNRALVILPNLKAGQSKTYTLRSYANTKDLRTNPNLIRNKNDITLSSAGRKVLTYNGDLTTLPAGIDPSVQRGGYIHPVLSPAGKQISDDYAPNHPHHHGLWAAWTKTDFEGRHPDFWNMQDKKGRVEFVSIEQTFAGALACGFSANHRYVDLTAPDGPKTALNETWETTVYRVGTDPNKPYFLFDVTLTQTCATDQPLILPKYLYGGIAFRGRRDWNGKGDACIFLTSEDKTRANGNETTARWCYIGGKVPGENNTTSIAGLAILSHPANFRAPQPVRIHPDMPYFTFAPQQMGEFKIEPGRPYISRYRIITTDGPADKTLLDRQWTDFANPPEVTLK